MSLTPVEIRHVRLGRRPLGYDRKAVDRLLEEVAASFEVVWRERADLRDHLERVEAEVVRFRDLEGLLKKTLLSAERAAEDLRAQARREADLIVEEARVKAREIANTAEVEREKIRGETRRLRAVEGEMRAGYKAFLLAALDRIESDTQELEAPDQAA